MSLLFRASRAPVDRSFVPPSTPVPWFGGWTHAGQSVVPDNACRSAAVAACRRVIVSSVVGLPVESFSMRAGRSERNRVDPAIVRAPSAKVRRRGWLAQIVNSLVLHGNAYVLVTSYDAMARPATAEVLHWTQVSWSQGDAYIAGDKVGLWPVGDLLMIQATPFLKPGSPTAESPVELAKQSVGAGLAAEEFGSRFFADGAFPSGVIYSENEETEESARGIKDMFLAAIGGTREPVVMGAGLKWEQLQIEPGDSQFIDLMRFEIEQACRFFGIPPQMVYAAVSGQAVTYSNATTADMSFLKYSLKPWLEDVEEGWSDLLPGPQSVRFNVDQLLRMDALSRHTDQRTRLESMTATVNEVRAEEDKDPFVELDDDGVNVYDRPGIPGGSAPATSLEGDDAGLADAGLFAGLTSSSSNGES